MASVDAGEDHRVAVTGTIPVAPEWINPLEFKGIFVA